MRTPFVHGHIVARQVAAVARGEHGDMVSPPHQGSSQTLDVNRQTGPMREIVEEADENPERSTVALAAISAFHRKIPRKPSCRRMPGAGGGTGSKLGPSCIRCPSASSVQTGRRTTIAKATIAFKPRRRRRDDRRSVNEARSPATHATIPTAVDSDPRRRGGPASSRPGLGRSPSSPSRRALHLDRRGEARRSRQPARVPRRGELRAQPLQRRVRHLRLRHVADAAGPLRRQGGRTDRV